MTEPDRSILFRGTPEAVTEWMSPDVTSLLGWQPEDFVGQSVREFLHPDDLVAMAGTSEDVNAGAPSAYRARLRHADGGYRWMLIEVRPILDDSGVVVGREGTAVPTAEIDRD